jgi:hypothetical protein
MTLKPVMSRIGRFSGRSARSPVLTTTAKNRYSKVGMARKGTANIGIRSERTVS